MKRLFTLLIFIGGLAQANAQCTPQGDFSNVDFGAIPDTIQNFQPALINSLYTQQIDVKIPSNGAFAGLAFLTVDSAQLVSISNLPPGLGFECNSPLTTPCTFVGGSVGCGIIAGIPTELGTYELDVLLLIYTNFSPDPLPFLFEGYRIAVSTVISVPEAQPDFNYIRLKPNPANLNTVLSTYVNQQGKGVLRVFDLVGKQVLQTNLQLLPGQNNVTIGTAALPEGIYLCVIEAFGQRNTRRLMVAH